MSFYYLILYFICTLCTIYSHPSTKKTDLPIKFFSREDWNATPASHMTPLSTPVAYVVVHHTYLPPACNSHEECVTAMRGMQNYHNSLGWGDIGYNFCIGSDGGVYEGRGWENKGIHAGPANGVSVGICLIGDWRVSSPPEEMIAATLALIEIGVARGSIKADYKVIGHSQAMKTECPGAALSNIISKWEHFSNTFTRDNKRL
ncbi:peptidoglycan-recognition protein LB-like [Leptidea sinapis]|uniref:peptidoglycan-recognition protein LB-like n=1 Tax=Leptidea sinapis TaxID=189913 RepID=UPI0021430A01|nr:peptidoglycan-recognition protein LB-like [Leptidea sinapis]